MEERKWIKLGVAEKTPGKSLFDKLMVYFRDTQGRIFAVATLMPVAALGLLSLADSNRAAGADPQKDALKTGAQLWVENCTMCHEVKPRTSFSPAESDAAKLHMRDKADLSPEEQEAILGFLKSGN